MQNKYELAIQFDWLSFAKQQAEFYRNAGQYITNLQIDIKEIDDEIEDILLETEDANCNVAQGYKVFKRLKNLRLEKKVKTRELNCLYALTDYIDCESLADTCDCMKITRNILLRWKSYASVRKSMKAE